MGSFSDESLLKLHFNFNLLEEIMSVGDKKAHVMGSTVSQKVLMQSDYPHNRGSDITNS